MLLASLASRTWTLNSTKVLAKRLRKSETKLQNERDHDFARA
jgi:hypothetical protein